VEFSAPPDSRGEVLVFQKGKEPDQLHDSDPHTDEENGPAERIASPEAALATRRATMASVQEMKKELHATKDVFTWRNVCCDVLIKGEPRRLLSNVFGYVKPGTLTALMGESGAGKTTLLDTYVPCVRWLIVGWHSGMKVGLSRGICLSMENHCLRNFNEVVGMYSNRMYLPFWRS
jgi:ABC-type multidrug transport system fused ATPase/permease subunit